MVEKAILYLIKLINHLGKELQRAYYETFGDKELMHEFNIEANKRCEKNKEIFIEQAARYIGNQVYKEQNLVLPQEVAFKMGEMMFYSAKQEGKIDILNNVIE